MTFVNTQNLIIPLTERKHKCNQDVQISSTCVSNLYKKEQKNVFMKTYLHKSWTSNKNTLDNCTSTQHVAVTYVQHQGNN